VSINVELDCFICKEHTGDQLATFRHIAQEHPEDITTGQIISMTVGGQVQTTRMDTGEPIQVTLLQMIVRDNIQDTATFHSYLMSEEYTDWFLRHLEIARQQQADHPLSVQPMWRVVLRNAWTTFRRRWGL
jgi:hypothetical protein